MNKQTIITGSIILGTCIFLVANRITNVECTVDEKPCDTDFQTKLQKLKGKSFFFSPLEKLSHTEAFSAPTYTLQSIQKRFPGTIELNYSRESAQYAIKIEENTQYIGESGTVLPQESDFQQLTVIWNQEASPLSNNSVTDKYHALMLAAALKLQKIPTASPQLLWNSDSEIILKIEKQPNFIFDTQTLETGLKKIDTILQARELAEVEGLITEIDMRYDLPVLRTAQ